MPDPRNPSFVDLIWLLEMSHQQYLERFRGTAIRRAKHWMLQRNAAVALGNTGGLQAVEPLVRVVRANPHPIVRGHAAWALGRIGMRNQSATIIALLHDALSTEPDESVREEMRLALADIAPSRPH